MSILDDIKDALFGDDAPHDHAHDGPSLEETYAEALEAQRAEKDHFFHSSPYSPIPHEALHNWTGLNYYAPNPALRLVLPLQREESETLTFQTSTGDVQDYERLGTVTFEVEGEAATLAIYQGEEGDLFLPFRDETSGNETYGAGRYLEPVSLADDDLLIDFNLAYNPYCAYSPDYSCPLPPIENWLKVPIRAGEKAYKAQAHDDEA